MDRIIILTTGTSIFRNLNKKGLDPEDKNIFNKLSKSFIKNIGKDASSLSAELSTLDSLKVQKNDEIVFIATDSDNGRKSAKMVEIVCNFHFDIKSTKIELIQNLTLDDSNIFKNEGLSNLVDTLEHLVKDNNKSPIISVSGGIKPIIPYVAAFSMLRRVPLTYIFEKTRELITLPGLPIEFDFELLFKVSHAIQEMNEKISIPKEKLINILGYDNYLFIESLFVEEDDGKISPSIFGMMLLDDIETAAKSTVLLSSNASKIYEKAKKDKGLALDQFDFMLERVKNPFWRSYKIHKFSETDLLVWKPGRTPNRMAGWLDKTKNEIYIAELYESHDKYEKHLPGRKRKQYIKDSFIEWKSSNRFDDMTEDEKDAQIVLDNAAKKIEKALQKASRAEEQKLLFKSDNIKLQEKINELEKQIDKHNEYETTIQQLESEIIYLQDQEEKAKELIQKYDQDAEKNDEIDRSKEIKDLENLQNEIKRIKKERDLSIENQIKLLVETKRLTEELNIIQSEKEKQSYFEEQNKHLQHHLNNIGKQVNQLLVQKKIKEELEEKLLNSQNSVDKLKIENEKIKKKILNSQKNTYKLKLNNEKIEEELLNSKKNIEKLELEKKQIEEELLNSKKNIDKLEHEKKRINQWGFMRRTFWAFTRS